MHKKYLPDFAVPVKCAIATAFLGASFATPAHAAFISTKPAGTQPVTFNKLYSGQYFLDLDKNGKDDYFIAVNSLFGLTLEGSKELNIAETDGFFARPYADLSSPTSSIKQSSLAPLNGIPIATDTPFYVRLKFIGEQESMTPGYIKGELGTVLDDNMTSLETFSLLDFGYEAAGQPIDPNPVPEPGSLALLAAGAAGIGALRRRRASTR